MGDDLVGIATTRLDTHRSVTDRPSHDVGAERTDHTGVLESGDLDRSAPRVGIQPHPLQDVGPVDRRVFDVDHDLVTTGRGIIDLLDRENFGTTVGSEHDCTHAAEPTGS